MLSGRTAAVLVLIGCCLVGAGLAQNPPASPNAAPGVRELGPTLAENWNDFLHYTKIGRFDLAKGYGRAVLQGNPDPSELFRLVEENRQGYDLAMKVAETAHDEELAKLSQQLLGVIDQGRFARRTEPKLIVEEIRRLSSTPRGKMMAIRRLKDAGEYAVPFLLEIMGNAIQDPSSETKLADMIEALPQIGRPAIRPLAAALQMQNGQLKAEVIRALGRIGYPQSLPYLKYAAERAESPDLRSLALESIGQVDPRAANTPAAALFYQLGERYYYHDESLAATQGVPFGNIWFWDLQAGRLVRVEVAQAYFPELMTMQCCEWSLRADQQFGMAIGLWLAAFFKAESTGIAMPGYFGANHANALVYATTAGPEYLHQALTRAVNDRNAAVALGAVEALATNAGEKSLMYTLGPSQPLLAALVFPDRAVRYSAAIAIANAGPRQPFNESGLLVQNLAEALTRAGQPTVAQAARAGQSAAGIAEPWTTDLAQMYTLRSAQALLKLAISRNPVIDLTQTLPALAAATKDPRQEIRILAGQTLAYLNSPNAQQAIAAMALDAANEPPVRLAAFESLSHSAKLNGNMLPDTAIDELYKLISSAEADPALRAGAAAAYGSLNLPSQKVKDLILDQARS